MAYQIEITAKRLQLAEMLLEVSEKPFDIRVIVSTELPDMANPWEEDSTLYFMIEKCAGRIPVIKNHDTGEWEKDAEGRIVYQESKLFNGWRVSDSSGNGSEFPTAHDVLNFFDRIHAATDTNPHVESF